MNKKKFTKLLALYLPYLVNWAGCDQSWRGMAAGRG